MLFLGINGLFVLKYTSRTTYSPILFFLFYILAVFGVIIFFYFIENKINQKITNFLIGLSSLSVILGVLVLHSFINPYELMIDRWSAIHNFISNLFNGEYPYAAQTHLGGYASPFPVWQIFHIPFYLAGNVALAMIFSILMLFFGVMRWTTNKKNALFFILLLAISPAFWYEVAVRSDLCYNFLLVFLTLLFFQHKNYNLFNNTLLIGLICGLFLSTRVTIVIPFFVYLLVDFFKINTKKKIAFLGITITIFACSFLPLVFWNHNTLFFFEYNPFVLQTRQGSIFEIILIASISFFFAFKWKKDFIKYNAYTAIILIVFVIITFLHRMINENFENNLFSSSFDITYFNMALPFLIFAIAYNNQKLQHT